MPARSQGELYMQRRQAHLTEKDVHRWVFAFGMTPGVEFTVRKWLSIRLDGFYCDLQPMYTPHAHDISTQARTHVVLGIAPQPLTSMAGDDEARTVNAHGLSPTETAKAIIKATGLNPHLSVCGWPFCLDELDWNENEGGAI